MVMTHTHAEKVKVRGHSVQNLEWKRTDGGDSITSRVNAVGDYLEYLFIHSLTYSKGYSHADNCIPICSVGSFTPGRVHSNILEWLDIIL